MISKQEIENLNKEFSTLNPKEILLYISNYYPFSIKLSSSMGNEDQYLTHLIATEKLNINIFTIDTGRLFPETYSVIERTREKYNIKINVYFPEASQVEAMMTVKGPNLFYESVFNRKLCCLVRKMEPLKRALKGMDCWITGLRREQSDFRADMQLFEWNEEFNLLKVNPLINFTEDDIKNEIKLNNIPYNKLYDKNFLSIGCAPCTRAVEEGEDARAGRWWWEDTSRKECGLHESE